MSYEVLNFIGFVYEVALYTPAASRAKVRTLANYAAVFSNYS